ncbi:MAG: LysM peptidoglycan-binding domain-containing protein [Verrucomicrobiota bacterium]
MPLGANIPTGGGTPNTSFFLSGGDQAQGSAESPVHTPEHNLPRHEYPFDDKGRYREEWVTAPSSTMSSAPRSSSAERTGSSISFNRRSTMQFHIVQPGDSIWTISRRYDVSHIKLQELNRLAGEPQPGDTLRIP